MVCSLRLSKDPVELKQVQRKTTKIIKQLPNKGELKNAGLFVMERKTLRGTVEYYRIMMVISRRLVLNQIKGRIFYTSLS